MGIEVDLFQKIGSNSWNHLRIQPMFDYLQNKKMWLGGLVSTPIPLTYFNPSFISYLDS